MKSGAIICAIVALAGFPASAQYTKTADLTLCAGDVLEIYESHSSAYTLTATSDRTTVATATKAADSVASGKFFTVTAVNVGTATVTLTSKKSGTTDKLTFNLTVNAVRTVKVNGTVNVTGWANSSESGNGSWTTSVSPDGAASVSLTQQSTSAVAATLTGKTVGDATVTLSNLKSGKSGFKYIYEVKVESAGTPIGIPTAATGLVWGMTNQVGVAAGEGYVRGGICEASAVGEYAATVTPDKDHCWPDLSCDTKTIKWKIARRPATVTVLPADKAPNDPEPVFHTKNEGFLAEDTTELIWTAWRTNTDETAGTYDVVIFGEREQGGYDITYVGNSLTIAEKPVGPKLVPVTDLTEAIYGAEPEAVRIVSQTGIDITSAFTLTGNATDGVTAALNREASVAFDLGDGKAETITVMPTLTETGDETVEPFEVAADEVDVGVKTIPGLTYALKRSAEPRTVSEGKVVDEKRAEGLRTKLTDPMEGGKPAQAFYVIEVRK